MDAGFQREMWANGVGDDWFKRNKEMLGNRDMASEALQQLSFQPSDILEIGAANGWRLKKLKDRYGCNVRGIDVSQEAIKNAIEGIDIDYGYAHDLPYEDSCCDVVIFGFCLCFISPEDWLPIVAESNRVLRDGGIIVIYDFMGTRFVKRAMKSIMADSKLEERPVYLYNFDWPSLWIPHPGYKVIVELLDMNKSEAATIIQKNISRLLDDDIRVIG